MKKLSYSFYFFLFLLGLQSCVKDVEVKLPEAERKLVLSAFICPQDERTLVSVTMSQPIYNTPENHDAYLPVPNATVVISTASNSWTLPYDATIGRYVIDSFKLKVKAGVTYNLSVSTPDGKFADAVTTVPALNSSLVYTISKNASISQNHTLHAAWQDPPNSTDYYELELSSGISATVLQYRSERFSDSGNDGGTLKKDMLFYYEPIQNDTIFIALSTFSPECFTYLEQLDKVLNSGNGPFSEPIAMYKNINGGFGIFAGFNRYKIRVFPL